MRVLLKCKRSQLAIDVKRRGEVIYVRIYYYMGSMHTATKGRCLTWIAYFRWLPNMQFVIISNRHELTKKLCASSTGKLFHVTTPLRLFYYASSQMGA